MGKWAQWVYDSYTWVDDHYEQEEQKEERTLNVAAALTKEGIVGDTRSEIAQEYLDYFKGFYKEFTRSGSRVICNPPPLDTDDDYIILCKDKSQWEFLCECLASEGFEYTGNSDYPGEKDNVSFASYRKEDLNLIVTHDEDYYKQFVRATKLATKLNLLNKEDRVSLFKAVARNDWTEFEPLERYKRKKERYTGFAGFKPIVADVGRPWAAEQERIWENLINPPAILG